jgi:hypothetical protein
MWSGKSLPIFFSCNLSILFFNTLRLKLYKKSHKSTNKFVKICNIFSICVSITLESFIKIIAFDYIRHIVN